MSTGELSAPGALAAILSADSTGYADVYFYAGRSAAGEQVGIRAGVASCSATL